MDEYGFERPDDFDYESYEEFMSSYLKVLARRAKKWAELLGDHKSVKRNLTMKRYIRKGIPAEFRGKVSTRVKDMVIDTRPSCWPLLVAGTL